MAHPVETLITDFGSEKKRKILVLNYKSEVPEKRCLELFAYMFILVNKSVK